VDAAAAEAPETQGDVGGELALVAAYRSPAFHDLALELLPLLAGLETGDGDGIAGENGVPDSVAGDGALAAWGFWTTAGFLVDGRAKTTWDGECKYEATKSESGP